MRAERESQEGKRQKLVRLLQVNALGSLGSLGRSDAQARLALGALGRRGRRSFALCLLLFTLCLLGLPISPVQAQLLKKSEYGVGMTIAVYQFDDARSAKALGLTAKLKETASSAEEEREHLTRTFGLEDVKLRHARPSVGLREGEPFTETQMMNDKPLVIVITPRLVTREDVSFDVSVKYADKVLMEFTGLSANSYETIALRGARSGFGVREFKGPDGTETVPEQRAILVTVTPAIILAKGLQNKPSDISRPSDQFGTKVELAPSDTFEMPTVAHRAPVKFAPGSRVVGSMTLQGVVTPEGRITNVRVLDTPDSALNAKVIEAFRQYRFNPAKLNGRATYATYRETIVFGKDKPL